MTKDVLKYLDLNACVPIDTATTIMLVNALKEALAQRTEQEPVAWMSSSALISFQIDRERYPLGGGGNLSTARYAKSDHHNTPLYTTPPQRTWVGLTDERVKEIWLKGKDHGDDWLDVLALARSFEAELKELNT